LGWWRIWAHCICFCERGATGWSWPRVGAQRDSDWNSGGAKRDSVQLHGSQHIQSSIGPTPTHTLCI
jgi:hypothetical protein